MAFELSMHPDPRWELLGSCVGLPYVFFRIFLLLRSQWSSPSRWCYTTIDSTVTKKNVIKVMSGIRWNSSMIIFVNIELPRSLYLKMQHGLYPSRSSQPCPRLSLSSQKHHRAEPIYLNTLVRLWWSTLSSQIDHSIDQFQFLYGLKKTKSNKKCLSRRTA